MLVRNYFFEALKFPTRVLRNLIKKYSYDPRNSILLFKNNDCTINYTHICVLSITIKIKHYIEHWFHEQSQAISRNVCVARSIHGDCIEMKIQKTLQILLYCWRILIRNPKKKLLLLQARTSGILFYQKIRVENVLNTSNIPQIDGNSVKQEGDVENV